MRFGRKPRTHDPRIPLLTKSQGITLPVAVNYANGMRADLGMMMNDILGCCVEACQGHSEQVWSFNSSIGTQMVTPSDAQIEAAYELEGGWVPGNPSTDQGTIIQIALQDWLNNPIAGNEIVGFVEIDVANMQAIKETIFECGLAVFGFNVPSYLNMNPGSIWDYRPDGDNTIIGGHCTANPGYLENGNLNVISWGSASYQMTPAFVAEFCDEIYAVASKQWIEAIGTTPGGLTIAQLEALMASMKVPTGASNRRRHRHHRRIKRKRAHEFT